MPGLFLHHSNCLEKLADSLSDLITLQADVFSPETIIVQSSGMERWLKFRIAEKTGIAANLSFPFPNVFISRIFRELLGSAPFESHFRRDTLALRLFDLMESNKDDLAKAGFLSILNHDPDGIKRYAFSDTLADLYDQYSIFRPQWITSWEKGEQAISGDEWQASIFRKVSYLCNGETRLKTLSRFSDTIKNGAHTEKVGLLKRVSIFGVSSLPLFHLEVLAQLSLITEVHFFVLNPCKEHWFDIVTEDKADRISLFSQDDLTLLHLEEGNPLLASFGTHGREFINTLFDRNAIEKTYFINPESNNLLSKIQSDMLNLSKNKFKIKPDDTSLLIHECHEKIREVQVLYDTLLSHFEKDPLLEPQDIIVMAPDIDEYSQAIHAVFENPENTKHKIPFRISDQTAARSNTWISAFMLLLDLPDSRITASDMLALLSNSTIRKRFLLSETDVNRLMSWMGRLNMAWGLDAEHKKEIGLPQDEANTFQFGSDRLLLGFAMADDFDEPVFGRMPFSVIEGDGAQLAGIFAELIATIRDIVSDLHLPRLASDWTEVFPKLMDRFAEPEDEDDRLPLTHILLNLKNSSLEAECNPLFSFRLIRKYLKDRLERSVSSHGFLSAGATFCSMLPMRSIPFKIIALLGMDNEYPRQSHYVSFDLMGRRGSRRPNDRSSEQDDRYIFLESLLSARKILHISYSMRYSGGKVLNVPSPVITELLDYLAERSGLGLDNIHELVMVHHPLQPFSPQYFNNYNGNIFTFSKENERIANAIVSNRPGEANSIIHKTIKAKEPAKPVFFPKDVLAFFRNPSKFFAINTLGIRLKSDFDIPLDHEPFEIRPFDAAKFRRLLIDDSKKIDADSLFAKAGMSGALPPRSAGAINWQLLEEECDVISEMISPWLVSLDKVNPIIDIERDNYRISGPLTGRFGPGLCVLTEPVRLTASKKIWSWLIHLMANSSIGPMRTLLVTRRANTIEFAPPDDPKTILDNILSIMFKGLSVPLPFFPELSMLFAEQFIKYRKMDSALTSARQSWKSSENNDIPSEKDDDYAVYLWSGINPADHSEFGTVSSGILDPLIVSLNTSNKDAN